jgi:hAT family C-terminal dimerisation region
VSLSQAWEFQKPRLRAWPGPGYVRFGHVTLFGWRLAASFVGRLVSVSSVSSERAFSSAGITTSKRRNCLRPTSATVAGLICLVWLDCASPKEGF